MKVKQGTVHSVRSLMVNKDIEPKKKEENGKNVSNILKDQKC